MLQLGSQLGSKRIPAAGYQRLHIFLPWKPAHHGTSTWYEGSFLYTASMPLKRFIEANLQDHHAVRCCSMLGPENPTGTRPSKQKFPNQPPISLGSWDFPKVADPHLLHLQWMTKAQVPGARVMLLSSLGRRAEKIGMTCSMLVFG